MQTLRPQTLRPALTGLALAGLALAGLTAAPAAHAQATTTVYSNIDDNSFENSAYPFAKVSGTGPTNIVADDITPITGFAGDQVTSFTFSTYSFNDADVTATPTAYFYSANNGGNPGTLLASVPLAPVTIPSNEVELYTETSPTGYFALPVGTFWAGISYSGADADTLNNLTQLFYSPPTIGSSNDGGFQTTAPADSSSNPSGETFTVGGEVTNFGWAFDATAPAAVPEASTTISFGLLLTLGLGGLAVAARKKKAAA